MNMTPEVKDAIATIVGFFATLDDRKQTHAGVDRAQSLWIRCMLNRVDIGEPPADAAKTADKFIDEWRKRFVVGAGGRALSDQRD